MERMTLYSPGSAAVEFYDVLHKPGRVPALAGDIDFYRKCARMAGGSILELACGTGRVAIPLAKDGHEVTGLDLSEPMLRHARVNAAGLPVKFLKGDMERFELGRRFGLILIPFRSFQALLTPEAQRRCLDCIRRHLAPGGRAVINLFDPRLEYCVHGRSRVVSRYRRGWNPATGEECRIRVLERTNDAVRQILTERWQFAVRTGRRGPAKTSEQVLRIRWTYRWEMVHLLELCGLEAESCYGDFKGGPPVYGGEQIWVVRKASSRR